MNNRRAFSLVELLASISIGGVLMALGLGMVHRTMQSESSARTTASVERTSMRLSRQFRHDIHQAMRVSIDNPDSDKPALRLVLADQPPIIYQIEVNGLLRHQQAGSQTQREHFSFPDSYSIQFDELTKPTRTVLTLERDTKLVGVPLQVRLHLEAVVGQFLRPHPTKEVSP